LEWLKYKIDIGGYRWPAGKNTYECSYIMEYNNDKIIIKCKHGTFRHNKGSEEVETYEYIMPIKDIGLTRIKEQNERGTMWYSIKVHSYMDKPSFHNGRFNEKTNMVHIFIPKKFVERVKNAFDHIAKLNGNKEAF
jgi:hypothetical protein